MKLPLILVAIGFYCTSFAQTPLKTKNIFIITTDGFRWQELFTGADSAIINNTDYVKDTSVIKELFWDSNLEERRKKLMPFFWSVIAKKGQLYGNRTEKNMVNVKNIFKISYPGYNEILTGYADPLFIPNLRINNRNKNILEFFNSQYEYNGKVVAFTSWNMFPNILNVKRSKIPVNSGYDSTTDGQEMNDKINEVEKQVVEKGHTRYDLLTSVAAKEYISGNHPRIVFLSLGETDEFAHQNKYDKYLQQANAVDRMIADLWYTVQTDPFYKDNTTFIITTDHGRGNKAASWHGHNCFTKGSGEIWLAMIGPDIAPLGERRTEQKIYQNQFASTVALLLGEKYETSHKTGKAITSIIASTINNTTDNYAEAVSTK